MNCQPLLLESWYDSMRPQHTGYFSHVFFWAPESATPEADPRPSTRCQMVPLQGVSSPSLRSNWHPHWKVLVYIYNVYIYTYKHTSIVMNSDGSFLHQRPLLWVCFCGAVTVHTFCPTRSTLGLGVFQAEQQGEMLGRKWRSL